MTEKEKALNNIEAAIACGGGKMTPEMRDNFEKAWSGEKTTDEIEEELVRQYTNGGGKA